MRSRTYRYLECLLQREAEEKMTTAVAEMATLGGAVAAEVMMAVMEAAEAVVEVEIDPILPTQKSIKILRTTLIGLKSHLSQKQSIKPFIFSKQYL